LKINRTAHTAIVNESVMRYNTYRPGVYRLRSMKLEAGSTDDNYPLD